MLLKNLKLVIEEEAVHIKCKNFESTDCKDLLMVLNLVDKEKKKIIFITDDSLGAEKFKNYVIFKK